MADSFFEDELQKLILLASRTPPLQAPEQPNVGNQSAFRPFVEGSRRFRNNCSSLSMSKRMLEFLRKDWRKKMEIREPERQKNLKHVRNERMRRERERQSFFDLHSILPHGTRNEKISIVQSAVAEIRKLEKMKEELEMKNSRMAELERVARGGRWEEGGRNSTAKIRVRVENPTSGIDSLQEVLKCLKHMGLSTTSIGFELSNNELSAVFEIDNEIEAAAVEAVVRTTLSEVDTWLANERTEACTKDNHL